MLVFSPLGREEVREIARRLLASMAEALFDQRRVRLEYGPEVVEHLLDQGGYDPTLGARPMKRTIARLVEAPLAERLLKGELPRGSVALLEVSGGELDFDVVDPRADVAAGAAE